MPQRICCIPLCKSSLSEGAVLHAFPNPLTENEKFHIWVKHAGIVGEEANHIFKNRRICHLHFDKIYHYPKNRLSKLAIPTRCLPGTLQDVTRERQMPMAVDEQQSSTRECVYTDFTTRVVSHDATGDSTDPLTLAEQQPSTSEKTYSGPKTSASQSTCDKQPKVADNQQLSKINVITKKHFTCKRSNQRVIKSLEFSNQFELDLYKEVAKTQAQLKRCKKTKAGLLEKLKMANKFLRSKAYEYVTKDLSPTAKTFFDMQIKQCKKHPKGHRFTLDEKILALALYKPSPKAYRLLSQICVLPKKSTLNKLMSRTFLMPGANEIIFENLKKRVDKMPDTHKYCTVIFDEMAIAAHLSYDKHNDKIKGFGDDGSKRVKTFADHALVFMVRGIFKKYKQPVAYSFCTGTTKTESLKKQLKIILKKVFDTGLKVVATTCDQGSTNMAAINSLISDTRIEYLKNGKEFKGGFFEIDGKQIYPIYDPPHLIKGIRNNMLKKNLVFIIDGKKRTAKWAHLEALYKKGPSYKGMRLVPKLTARHVIPHMIPKMKVKYSTEVFSRTVSIAMGYTAGTGRIPRESQDTAELLLFFDKLFDSVNGNFNKIEKGKIYRSAVSPKSPHHKLWHKSLPVLKSMRFVGGIRAGVVPSITSWIKTIEAFQQITKKLHSMGLQSLLLRNFNQDPLENFFGSIRAHGHRNVMPTVPAFEASYKALLINNMVSPQSIGANCEGDDGYCLQNLTYFFSKNIARPIPENITIDFEHINFDLSSVDNLLKSQDPIDVEKCAAAAYCSGWIIKSIYKNIGSCSYCKEDLEGDSEETFSKYITMKKYTNKSFLYYPSKCLLECLLHIEEITIRILKTNCEMLQISQYIELVTTALVQINISKCKQHNEKVKKLFLNKSILLILNDWCREVNNVLHGKNTVYDESDPIKVTAHKYFVLHKSKNKTSK